MMDWRSQRPLLELACFVLAMALVGRERWMYVPLTYIIYRILASQLMKRIVATFPRDIKSVTISPGGDTRDEKIGIGQSSRWQSQIHMICPL